MDSMVEDIVLHEILQPMIFVFVLKIFSIMLPRRYFFDNAYRKMFCRAEKI